MEREPAMISLGAPSAPSVTGTPLNLSPAKTISPAALRINHVAPKKENMLARSHRTGGKAPGGSGHGTQLRPFSTIGVQ